MRRARDAGGTVARTKRRAPRAGAVRGFLLVALVCAAASAGCTKPQEEGYVVLLTADDRFEPDRLEVPVGSAVTWRMAADSVHNVEAYRPDGQPAFDSDAPPPEGLGQPMRAKGDSYRRVLTEPGEYQIHCHYHHFERMSMVLVVLPS